MCNNYSQSARYELDPTGKYWLLKIYCLDGNGNIVHQNHDYDACVMPNGFSPSLAAKDVPTHSSESVEAARQFDEWIAACRCCAKDAENASQA